MEPSSALSTAATPNGAGSSTPRRTDVAAILRYLAALLALTIIYAGAARAGLMLDAIAGFATLVWAPTGIALAALLLFGYRLWPAVFLGAFAVNLWTGAPLVAALGIALGNTLEAVAGTFALRRIPGFRPALDRLEDVASLIVVAAGVCTMISASIGVISLALAGTITPSQIAVTWRAWWLGDLVGALVVAPLLLVLGASVAERHRTEEWLRHAREIAEQANRAKSDFLAVMSHELRTPLNAISGYVELLAMELGGPVTPKQRDFLSRIQGSQGHLLSLIDEVLGFARLETGRLSLSLQPVIIYDMIVALEGMVEVELQKKRLTFTRHVSETSLVARADPEKLRQILFNLVANGMKFTPEGGRISVGAKREHGSVRLWVTDTGIGIPSDQLKHVFDPYFQVDRGPSRKFPGMGLGLAISRDLARAMDGEKI